MTAHAMNGDREKSLSVGMRDYIAKPIEPSVLLSHPRALDTPGRPLSPALSAAPRYPMHQPEHTPRTLFVDDESINQQIGAEILLALGPKRIPPTTAFQALRLIRTRHYAIVFTDVEMPVMDGATLTHILRSDSRYGELPIIACTAISSPEEEEALLQKASPPSSASLSTCRPCKRPSTAMPHSPAKPRALTGTQAPRRGGARHTGRT